MAAKTSGNSDEPISDINIVPFVDIILVVLIIFMVTAPVLLKPSINVNLPKSGSGDSTAPSELSIAIQANGNVSLNGKPTTETELNTYSKELAAKNPEVQAIVSADKDVTHGKVVSI